MLHGNRKLVVILLTLAAGFILALLGKLTAEFTTIASVCVAGYAAANAVEHNSKRGPSAPPG